MHAWCYLVPLPNFSDYIVFVDESGDHSLTSINPQFPAFALAFCIIRKDEYVRQVVPAVKELKFRYWGHDAVVLHEHEIRKEKGDFALLRTDRAIREAFMADLTQIMVEAPFTLITSVIDKNRLLDRYEDPWSPYHLALQFCMERLLLLMRERDQVGRTLHIEFECRGPAEDEDLLREFNAIIDGQRRWGWINRNFADVAFQPVFSKKSENSIGLQLADLTARPVALKTLRPGQPNRAYDIIEPKLRYSKVFP